MKFVSIKNFSSIFVKKSLGAALMISGSCIGIGMLAVPVSTSFAGFIPTLVAFVLAWFFMQTTALFLVEASQAYPDEKNLISLTDSILGTAGKYLTWGAFIFLFYCLLVAYIAKGGGLIQSFLVYGLNFHCPNFTGALIITLLTASLVFFGTLLVDRFNAIFMAGLVMAYFGLILIGKDDFSSGFLRNQDWTYFIFILPFIIPAFGFHNLLPTLKNYLNQDINKLRASIWVGSLLPLLVYTIWVMAIHGTIPGDILRTGFAEGQIATETVASYRQHSLFGLIGSYFAFFAIITSLITQSLSVFDFLADGLKLTLRTANRLFLISCIFVPTLFLSQLSPRIFFICLDWAGGVATMLLFGILPALMVWKINKGNLSPRRYIQIVLILGFSFLMICYEVYKLV